MLGARIASLYNSVDSLGVDIGCQFNRFSRYE